MDKAKEQIDRVRGLYVIYDKIADNSWTIFEAKNDDIAIRSYRFFIKNSYSKTNFELYRVGAFNYLTYDLESSCSLIDVREINNAGGE